MRQFDTNNNRFRALLAKQRPIVIDGGLATHCEAMGCDIDSELWSARLLHDDPDAIVAAHRAFLDAGAQIIATASYQASRQGFVAAGLSETQADELLLQAVALADRARAEFMQDKPGEDMPLIAASMGPYGAILHDGSEYTGDYDVSSDALAEFHEQRLQLLDGSDADLLAMETIPNGSEAIVLSELLSDCCKPAWISFCCRDASHLADGSPLAEAVARFNEHNTVLAVGANCVAPTLIEPLCHELRHAAPKQSIVVYPNSGETYRAKDNVWHGTATPLQCAQAVMAWLDAGANLVGGCCRIGPEQIAAMAAAVAAKR